VIPHDLVRSMFAAFLKGYRDGDGKALVRDFLKRQPEMRQRLQFFVTDMLEGFSE
jgi:hypothetical protein